MQFGICRIAWLARPERERERQSYFRNENATSISYEKTSNVKERGRKKKKEGKDLRNTLSHPFTRIKLKRRRQITRDFDSKARERHFYQKLAGIEDCEMQYFEQATASFH